MAPREQVHFYQVVAVRALQEAVIEPGELRLGETRGPGCRAGGDDVGLVLLLVPVQPPFQAAFRRRGLRTAEGPVGLVDLSFAEHLVETLQRFGGLGEHAEAADRPVEPVGEAQEDLAGFFVAPGDEGLVGIGQAFVARLVALRDLARALVHHQQVVVLVEDAPRQVVELLFCQLSVLHIAKIVFFRE